MGAEYYRKSGQIPSFGDWDNANDMPITQYFDCARQAGLLRCSCSGECGASYANNAAAATAYWGGGADLYRVGYDKSLPRRVYAVPERKSGGKSKGYPCPQLNEERKQVKVRDLMNQPVSNKHNPKQSSMAKSGNLVQQKSSISAKPVDEDLYKIPPHLLENSRRKKMLGFFSKCMVPPCAA